MRARQNTSEPESAIRVDDQIAAVTLRNHPGAARIVRRAAHRAGISKPVGPHTLRHAFITAALDAGVPLRDVQDAASHADPRTTMRYDRAAAALTGTRPTSSPPTSPGRPDSGPMPASTPPGWPWDPARRSLLAHRV